MAAAPGIHPERQSGVCGGRASSEDTGMAATTPFQAGLFEGYDRDWRRVEEQIGSGMLLRTLEARDQWYELRTGWLRGRAVLAGPVFQNEC